MDISCKIINLSYKKSSACAIESILYRIIPDKLMLRKASLGVIAIAIIFVSGLTLQNLQVLILPKPREIQR
jgi:hypothetical protein